MARFGWCFAILGLWVGCSRQARHVAEAPPPHVADAAPVVPPPLDAALDAAGTLPRVDDTCTGDADCDVLGISVEGPWACCSSCGTTPGNKTWSSRIKQLCAARPPGACPPLGCPQGPLGPHCQAGHCVALP